MTTLEDLYYGNIVPHEHSFKRGGCLQRSVELCYSASGQLDTDAYGSAKRNL